MPCLISNGCQLLCCRSRFRAPPIPRAAAAAVTAAAVMAVEGMVVVAMAVADTVAALTSAVGTAAGHTLQEADTIPAAEPHSRARPAARVFAPAARQQFTIQVET